jgi:PTS system mannose-specific IIA component
MSIALLLVTHGDIGKAIHDAAVSVIGSSPLRTQYLSINQGCRPEEMLNTAKAMISKLDTGDMYGSTPSNIACALQDRNVAVIAGLNLPMLIRILNYPNLPLSRLVNKAVSGGQEGVIFFHPTSSSDVAQGN